MTQLHHEVVPNEGGEYLGRYKGFVRKVDDPDKQGRVRCYCPAVMGVDSDNDQGWLDWAMVSYGYGHDNSSDDFGMVCVPDLGTPVWIEFEQGNPDFPIVSGVWVAGDTGSSSLPKLGKGQSDPQTVGESKTNAGITVPASSAGTPTYPKNKIIKTKAGFIIEIDETTGNQRLRIRHPSGSFTEYTHPGSLVQQVVADLLLWVGSSFKATAVGQIILGVGTQLLLGGTDSIKSVPLGEDLLTELNARITLLNSHTHPVSGASTGVPVLPQTSIPASVLSNTVKVK